VAEVEEVEEVEGEAADAKQREQLKEREAWREGEADAEARWGEAQADAEAERARKQQQQLQQQQQREEARKRAEGRSPICTADLGAAVLTRGEAGWELAGVGLYAGAAWWQAAARQAAAVAASPAAASASASSTTSTTPLASSSPHAFVPAGCDGVGKAWSVHASRCWIEASMRGWGLAPADAAATAECGARDFFAPDVAALAAATGGVSLPATGDSCAALDCGRHGRCAPALCQLCASPFAPALCQLCAP